MHAYAETMQCRPLGAGLGVCRGGMQRAMGEVRSTPPRLMHTPAAPDRPLTKNADLENPAGGHDDHEVAALAGYGPASGSVARLVCLTCEQVLRSLPVCGKPTKQHRPCRAPIRVDLGYSACQAHP